MLEITAFLVAVGPLAIGVTKLVDWVRSFDKDDAWWPGYWILLSMVLGVIYALLTGTNFTDLINGLRPEVSNHLAGTWGQVVTGLAIGGTASFWHEHLDRTSQAAKLNRANAAATTGMASSG